MEKRALLAVVLSIVVIIFFQTYIAPPQKPQPPTDKQKDIDLYSADREPGFPGSEPDAFAVEGGDQLPSVAAEPAGAGEEVIIDTDLYTATFTTRGAVLKSFILKNYLDKLGEDARPVEMVTAQASGRLPLVITLIGKESINTGEVLFDADRERLALTRGDSPAQVVFTGVTSQGIHIEKTITFYAESYFLNVSVAVTEPPTTVPHRGAVITWVRVLDPEKDKPSRLGFTGPAVYAAGRLHEIKLKDLDEENKAFARGVDWAGYEEKYFMAAFLSCADNPPLMARITHPVENTVLVSCYDEGEDSASEGGSRYSYGFFCGPKEIEMLKTLGMNLEKAIDFGMFDVIAKPLLYALKYLNTVTHNYGLAIIIITIILKVVTFPLTHKSYKSMKALKDLQPKIEALKKKYKDDRDRLNMETMNLYRTYKVNPLGGCLPLVIQFPIFIAFYWVLLGSIELRHSPFIFWIRDLSAQDPFYITPLLMGASMFIQQKMTPTAADPTQAKMMLAMPIVFTVLFLNFPSGLVIYWLVNNVLQIFQQIYIDKRVS